MNTSRLVTVALLVAGVACKSKAPPPAEPAAVVTVARTIEEAPNQWITRDSVRLRYKEAGEGTAVVILLVSVLSGMKKPSNLSVSEYLAGLARCRCGGPCGAPAGYTLRGGRLRRFPRGPGLPG